MGGTDWRDIPFPDQSMELNEKWEDEAMLLETAILETDDPNQICDSNFLRTRRMNNIKCLISFVELNLKIK